ncbi:hypothetical protein STANM309S_01634 [Streptomyces tanashiensis]
MASGSSWTGVPSARTGRTHSVPGAIQTASRSGVSWTTVTGRQMCTAPVPLPRYRQRMCSPGAQC